MIKLIATDLDGTLVNDQGKINSKVYDMIHNLNERGIKFAAASGRFYSQLNKNFDKVDTDMIFVAHNGALVKYNKNGRILYSNCICEKDIKSIINLKCKQGMELFLAAANDAYIVNPTEDILNKFNFWGVPAVVIKSFDEVKEPVYKVTYYVEEGVKTHMIEYLKENLSDNVEFVVSGDCWIDIMNKGVSKGSAIKILQEKFNIHKRDTMVFGDYYNDLTMFREAYYSYAMENAPQDVKKHARFVAQSNNDNGVYNVINKYAVSL
ncbi:Cof-type HAD-IIB family hydrolase [Haloimpatiens sp. FM7330]|uniref:Cof-type HAD-IIB family hydrolase n=1 Tax=Haloimpatiens sp. FM7330 TaxID=3298610 RepID=UPI00363C0195